MPARKSPVAVAPAAPLSLAELAAGARQVDALPKVARAGGGGTGGAFGPLVKRSYDEKTPLALPPVPAESIKTLRNALRRAAAAHGLGVSIRPEQTPDGWVVNFQAKDKRAG